MLAVRDEGSLLRWRARIEAAAVRASLFREPDLDGAATALATEAIQRGRARVLRGLKLASLRSLAEPEPEHSPILQGAER